jgi:hypothetical protein
MWLIGTKTKIQGYIDKVDAYNKYEADTTESWGEPWPNKDKTQYAVMKNESVEPDSQLTEKEELPSDWQPDDLLA